MFAWVGRLPEWAQPIDGVGIVTEFGASVVNLLTVPTPEPGSWALRRAGIAAGMMGRRLLAWRPRP